MLALMPVLLQDGREDPDKKYKDKVISLLNDWAALASHSTSSLTDVVEDHFHILYRETLHIVVRSEWRRLEPIQQNKLLQLLTETSNTLMNKPAHELCLHVIRLVENPWNNPTLVKVIAGETDIPDLEVLEFCLAEKADLLSTRLDVLSNSKCEDIALKLVAQCRRCLQLNDARLKAASTAEQQDYWLDLHLALLFNKKRMDDCISIFNQMKLEDGDELVQRLIGRTAPVMGRARRVWRNSRKVAELVYLTLLRRALLFVPPLRDCLQALAVKLVHLERMFMGATPEQVTVILRQLMVDDNSILKITSANMYHLCSVLTDEFQEELNPFCIELIIRALTMDLNELEKMKLNSDKAAVKLAEEELSQHFGSLAVLVKHDQRICREVTLTEFSLQPTPERLDKLAELAALAAPDSTNPLTTTSTRLERQEAAKNLGVSESVLDGLSVVIHCQRWQVLCWAEGWKVLGPLCQRYVLDRDSMRSVTTEFNHLQVDYSKFKEMPQPEKDKFWGIEKGYENFLSSSEESETYYSTPPPNPSASSKRKRKFGWRRRKPSKKKEDSSSSSDKDTVERRKVLASKSISMETLPVRRSPRNHHSTKERDTSCDLKEEEESVVDESHQLKMEIDDDEEDDHRTLAELKTILREKRKQIISSDGPFARISDVNKDVAVNKYIAPQEEEEEDKETVISSVDPPALEQKKRTRLLKRQLETESDEEENLSLSERRKLLLQKRLQTTSLQTSYNLDSRPLEDVKAVSGESSPVIHSFASIPQEIISVPVVQVQNETVTSSFDPPAPEKKKRTRFLNRQLETESDEEENLSLTERRRILLKKRLQTLSIQTSFNLDSRPSENVKADGGDSTPVIDSLAPIPRDHILVPAVEVSVEGSFNSVAVRRQSTVEEDQVTSVFVDDKPSESMINHPILIAEIAPIDSVIIEEHHQAVSIVVSNEPSIQIDLQPSKRQTAAILMEVEEEGAPNPVSSDSKLDCTDLEEQQPTAPVLIEMEMPCDPCALLGSILHEEKEEPPTCLEEQAAELLEKHPTPVQPYGASGSDSKEEDPSPALLTPLHVAPVAPEVMRAESASSVAEKEHQKEPMDKKEQTLVESTMEMDQNMVEQSFSSGFPTANRSILDDSLNLEVYNVSTAHNSNEIAGDVDELYPSITELMNDCFMNELLSGPMDSRSEGKIERSMAPSAFSSAAFAEQSSTELGQPPAFGSTALPVEPLCSFTERPITAFGVVPLSSTHFDHPAAVKASSVTGQSVTPTAAFTTSSLIGQSPAVTASSTFGQAPALTASSVSGQSFNHTTAPTTLLDQVLVPAVEVSVEGWSNSAAIRQQSTMDEDPVTSVFIDDEPPESDTMLNHPILTSGTVPIGFVIEEQQAVSVDLQPTTPVEEEQQKAAILMEVEGEDASNPAELVAVKDAEAFDSEVNCTVQQPTAPVVIEMEMPCDPFALLGSILREERKEPPSGLEEQVDELLDEHSTPVQPHSEDIEEQIASIPESIDVVGKREEEKEEEDDTVTSSVDPPAPALSEHQKWIQLEAESDEEENLSLTKRRKMLLEKRRQTLSIQTSSSNLDAISSNKNVSVIKMPVTTVDIGQPAVEVHGQRSESSSSQGAKVRRGRKVVGSKDSNPIECSKCSKQFIRSSDLSQHFRIHLGLKPYSCEFCPSKFTQISQLLQHARIHLEDRPYHCEICPWTFTQLSHLQAHVRSHIGDKPFKCPTCDKDFTRNSNLNRHLKLHKLGGKKV